MTSESEIWESLPGVSGVEVSTFGRVRMLDKVVSSERGTQFIKGRVLKSYGNGRGYLRVGIRSNGKRTFKYIHRLVAKTFLPNPNSLPEINHKDNNPLNNNASNLEWCTHDYNVAYREKYGTPAKNFVQKSPVYVVNLKTMETLWFESQSEASRVFGFSVSNINNVIMGKQKQTHGYWFTNADENASDAIKHKLEEA